MKTPMEKLNRVVINLERTINKLTKLYKNDLRVFTYPNRLFTSSTIGVSKNTKFGIVYFMLLDTTLSLNDIIYFSEEIQEMNYSVSQRIPKILVSNSKCHSANCINCGDSLYIMDDYCSECGQYQSDYIGNVQESEHDRYE